MVSTALVCVCQECFAPVLVFEQLELWHEEEQMGWTMTLEVCTRCDWARQRARAML